ncbi:MAG: membrane protein insertase YidC [Bacteroidales bacterium]|nr:membrane protein insertase YidC [Bacteroidales bacterium]
MNKKSIIGLVLILGIFVGYMFWVAPSKEEMAEMQRHRDSVYAAYNDSVRIADSLAAEKARLDSLATAGDTSAQMQLTRKSRTDLGAFNRSATGEAAMLTVLTDKLAVNISTLGAMVNSVILNDYTTYDSLPLELVTPSEENMNLVFSTEDNRVVNTRDLYFTPYVDGQPLTGNELAVSGADSLKICFRAFVANDSIVSEGECYLEFAYTLYGDSYEVDFDINFVGLADMVRRTPYMDFRWQNRMNRQEKVNEGSRGKGNRNADRERFYTDIYYKSPNDKAVDNLRMGQDKQKQVKTNLDWVAFKQQYFAAIINAGEGTPFENADLEVKTDHSVDAKNYLADMSAVIGLPYNHENPQMHMGFYYGPTKYRDLRAMHRSYERMLPLGWWIFSKAVSRYVIIPSFNLLERFIGNYGLLIIIFTLVIRFLLLPLMYKSYEGSAIMRALKPEMESLNKKYPKQEDAMKKQQEMMALQKRAGYNTMAGCLPMLIQMPILTAMFMFFPISIELRQKSFLWCNDLSTYDSILDFGFNIPLYGDHISLFCLLMFGMQLFQTWYSMKGQNMNAQMPGMKFMMYFMPFFMLFIFNSQSAGLNLYYFISLCFTVAVMVLARKLTTRKKVLARMAEYDAKHANGKGKPAKKSSFQKRLEELQKQADAMQRDQNRKR